MKILIRCLWLVAPVLVLAWRYGPGTDALERESAIDLVHPAHEAEIAEDFVTAHEGYLAAIAALPEDAVDARQNLQLSAAQTLINGGAMIEGQEALATLLSEIEDPDAPLAVHVRSELATAHYHAAWIMRLEGATADDWKPEAERSRQHFRLLAERAAAAKKPEAETFLKNLEAVIRFEQMDLSHLEVLGLPKNCPSNCEGGLCKRKRKQAESQCKGDGDKEGKGKKPSEEDARQVIKKQQKGAGVSAREGTGS